MTPRKRPASRRTGASSAGFMLLDVLIAVLVFSLGVLTVVSLQAASVQQSNDARYRADATLLANELISRMWVSDRQFSTLSAAFITGGDEYTNWLGQVTTTLPGAADSPPTVTVEQIAGGGATPTNGSRVTIVLRWQQPSDPAGSDPHNLTVVTQIK